MTKILIVDEDTDILRLLRIKLTGGGYEITQARDGQEALSLIETVQPDVVITELLLPDIDGLTMVAHLLDAPSPPLVLILSGKTAHEDISAALSAGVADYITKPFSPQGLLERIRINLIRAELAGTAVEERRANE